MTARFLNAATRIGRRLCRDAIWSDGRCNWMGWSMESRGGEWAGAWRTMGSSVYDGTAGIGLFLARLAALTDNSVIRATAEGALAHALGAAGALAEAGEYGFYSGLAGIGWAAWDAGAVLRHCGLIERGRETLRRAADLTPRDDRLDIINGSAGLIPTLLAAGARDSDPRWRIAATTHADHLLRTAFRDPGGWSWDTLGQPKEPRLLGFAHGTGGIAYALAAMGAAMGAAVGAGVGGDANLAAAREAMRYERGLFRPAEGNWPDLRDFAGRRQDGEKPCMLAWCHGAPGIGFGRLAMAPAVPDDPMVRAEAETAAATTLASLTNPGAAGRGNCSLCHGDFGNADMLLLAAERLGRADLRAAAEAVGLRALAAFEDARLPWPCGVPNAGETPNLLLGLAGIGWFLLRLAAPDTVPTALLPAGWIASATTGPPG